jgi:hypothetical protein
MERMCDDIGRRLFLLSPGATTGLLVLGELTGCSSDDTDNDNVDGNADGTGIVDKVPGGISFSSSATPRER